MAFLQITVSSIGPARSSSLIVLIVPLQGTPSDLSTPIHPTPFSRQNLFLICRILFPFFIHVFFSFPHLLVLLLSCCISFQKKMSVSHGFSFFLTHRQPGFWWSCNLLLNLDNMGLYCFSHAVGWWKWTRYIIEQLI